MGNSACPRLTSFLDTKGVDDPILEFEGGSVDELGADRIVYFPAMQAH